MSTALDYVHFLGGSLPWNFMLNCNCLLISSVEAGLWLVQLHTQGYLEDLAHKMVSVMNKYFLALPSPFIFLISEIVFPMCPAEITLRLAQRELNKYL